MADLLLTDLDNTLYNWVDYFAPSFRGMLHAISKKLDIKEDILIEEFKSVYTKYGSLEFSFTIQELESCKYLEEEDLNKIVELGRKVFKMVRTKHLQPYEGVKETLIWCVNNDVKVIGITNAPLFHAQMRLKELHLDGYFYGLAAWEGHTSENKRFAEVINQKRIDGKYNTKIKHTWSLPENFIKPSAEGYLSIIKTINVSYKNIYVVGDSITKDLAPATEIGAKTIWAKYGLDFDEKNLNTLLKITPWSQQGIQTAYSEKKISPDFIIDRFSQITDIIPSVQLNLFQ
jgi:FMN phosphatase YigB (HAD superfamily)